MSIIEQFDDNKREEKNREFKLFITPADVKFKHISFSCIPKTQAQYLTLYLFKIVMDSFISCVRARVCVCVFSVYSLLKLPLFKI